MAPLTDSTIASSSVCLKRFEPLCCFLPCWLFRGAGEDLLGVAELPRCWPKKLTVLSAGVCACAAGEAGPEGALEDEATGGRLDIAKPNQGSTMMRCREARQDAVNAIWRLDSVSAICKRTRGSGWSRRNLGGCIWVPRGVGDCRGGVTVAVDDIVSLRSRAVCSPANCGATPTVQIRNCLVYIRL